MKAIDLLNLSIRVSNVDPVASKVPMSSLCFRVSARCSRPDAVKVLHAYREAVWRLDARPLDLASTLEVIEGATVPIMVSRSNIVISTIDEILDADQHRTTECLDTRVPLEVSFRLEGSVYNIGDIALP